ncbi:TetR/AcrR family transcriptional regulator [Mycobacterium sp. URHB0021]|jgi:AcrR family transcriptional regulator
MAPQSISGKAGARVYRSDLRQQQAEQTRSRVVSAAAELFADHGYARTTLAKIAAAAGVSPETVQGHGPKAALIVAAIETAAFGVSGEENILNLEVGRRFLAIDDREEAIDFIVDAQTDVHERTARLALALFGAAASDPELDRYLNRILAGINGQIGRVLAVCRNRGWLREDVPFDEVVETAAVIAGVETYLRFVHREGWFAVTYKAWCRRMLAETVFR